MGGGIGAGEGDGAGEALNQSFHQQGDTLPSPLLVGRRVLDVRDARGRAVVHNRRRLVFNARAPIFVAVFAIVVARAGR